MFHIQLHTELCTGCGTCVRICPYLCFRIEGENTDGTTAGAACSRTTETAASDCVGCRSCQIRCIPFAIDVVENNGQGAIDK